MSRWLLWAALALTVPLAVGCVPKGKYDEALAEQEELRTQNAGLTDSLKQLGRDLADTESQLRQSASSLEEAHRNLATKITEAGQLQRSVEEMEQALAELERRKAQTEASMAAYRELVAKFQAMIDAGTLQVKVIEGRMVVELATDILFPPGSATLSKEGKQAIKDVAAVLAEIRDREYQIAGHTDDVPISNERFPSNWHLGSARAVSVADLLVASGLAADRLSAASYAEHRPADTNRTKEGRAANRRIEIIIVPDLSLLPGYDELQKMASGGAPE